MIKGYDISSSQRRIDWSKVDADRRFVIVRAGENDKNQKPTIDASFDAHVSDVAASSRFTGSYWVLHPHEDIEAQAQFYFDTAGGIVDMPPVLDFELPRIFSDPQVCVANAVAWVKRTQDLWKKKVAVYSFPDFWKRLGTHAADLAALCDLYMATYGSAPWVPPGFDGWKLWQEDDGHHTKLPDGVPVDSDQFNGDEAEFAQWCGIDVSPTG